VGEGIGFAELYRLEPPAPLLPLICAARRGPTTKSWLAPGRGIKRAARDRVSGRWTPVGVNPTLDSALYSLPQPHKRPLCCCFGPDCCSNPFTPPEGKTMSVLTTLPCHCPGGLMSRDKASSGQLCEHLPFPLLTLLTVWLACSIGQYDFV
jgi:hypothetical protein